jgi:ribonucleotide reductase alpha subunit
MSFFKKLKNIITGKDLNFDGKVDIKDKFIEAERNVKGQPQEIDLFKPGKEKK